MLQRVERGVLGASTINNDGQRWATIMAMALAGCWLGVRGICLYNFGDGAGVGLGGFSAMAGDF